MQNTTLYSTGSNSSTTCNCEDILDRHQERLICCTLRIRNMLVNCCHQFHNFVAPFSTRIFQSFQSGTFDNRAVCEFILFQNFSNFHFYQFKQLFIINHVAFVHEYNDVRYAYLTGQKDVLFCLSHNTVCSSYYQDSTIHLCSTGDHVLYIVSMAWAVNVCIMSVVCFILNVSGRDSDTSFSFFRSFVDVFEIGSFVSCNSFR